MNHVAPRTAGEWLARRESGRELAKWERERWDAWIADPLNNESYDRITRIRCTLASMPRPTVPMLDQLPGIPERNRFTAGRRWLRSTIAATLVGAPVLCFLLIRSIFVVDSGHSYTTGIAEQRQFTLSDGSNVTLGPDSSLTVTLSMNRRTVILRHGEAQFRVQHDIWRPFTVFAGGGSVTALGTVFDVRRYSDRVFVSVSEGLVNVQPHDYPPASLPQESNNNRSAAPSAMRVASGQEVQYDPAGNAVPPHPIEKRPRRGDAGGLLVYRDRPLHEVIEDIQRYSPRPIVLEPAVRDLLYSGTIVESDLDQWLRGLSKIFPVEVVRSRTQSIVIRSRMPPQLDAANVILK